MLKDDLNQASASRALIEAGKIVIGDYKKLRDDHAALLKRFDHLQTQNERMRDLIRQRFEVNKQLAIIMANPVEADQPDPG